MPSDEKRYYEKKSEEEFEKYKIAMAEYKKVRFVFFLSLSPHPMYFNWIYLKLRSYKLPLKSPPPM